MKEPALNRQRNRTASGSSRMGVAVEIAFIMAMDVAMVVAWTTFWHMSDMSGDGSIGNLLSHSMGFLSWTFLPCWGVGLVLIGLTYPLIQRMAQRNPAFVRALLTLLAPALWSLIFCVTNDEVDYTPTATLIAEAAWIVTLQPLWAYLAMYRLRAERS